MGIFDRVVQDAAEMTQEDPELAQPASQVAGVQAGQDTQAGQGMQAARNMIGRQRGARDQAQDGTGPGQEPDAGRGQDQDEGR